MSSNTVRPNAPPLRPEPSEEQPIQKPSNIMPSKTLPPLPADLAKTHALNEPQRRELVSLLRHICRDVAFQTQSHVVDRCKRALVHLVGKDDADLVARHEP